MKDPTGPYKGILDRELLVAANKDLLELADSSLTTLLDQCSWIFARCRRVAGSDALKAIPLFLYRHILESADANHILLARAASAPGKMHLRSIYEALLYLKFMIETDIERRIRCYIVCSYEWMLRHHARIAQLNNRAVPSHSGVSSVGVNVDENLGSTERIQEFLATREFREVRKDYADLRKKRRNWPHWYELAEPSITNLRQLSQHLRFDERYVLFDTWSRSIHPDLLVLQMEPRPDTQRGFLRWLRDGFDFEEVYHSTAVLLTEATHVLLMHYRKDEAKAFENWYKRTLASAFDMRIHREWK